MRTAHRRTLTALTLAVTVGASLAACSSSSSSPSAAPTAATLSGSITVFGASSLTQTFTTLAGTFEAAHPGVTVKTMFAGSGMLVTQIQQGAPADVFASASETPMTTAQSDKLVSGTPTKFATNTLEIAVPPSNPAKIASFADLAKSNVKLAICAATEPCGASTVAMEKIEGVTLKPASVEPAVANVLTAVISGQADAGLVYKTDVLGAGTEVLGVPFTDAPKVVNTYPIALLKEAKNPTLAKAFIAYVTGRVGQATLSAAGFGKP